MGARISEADARRLGIPSAPGIPPRGRVPMRSRAALPVATTAVRVPSKKGRLPNSAAPFEDVVFALSLEPRPKARARTFMPPAELARAFEAARGDKGRFLSIVRGGDADTRIRHHSITPKETAQFEQTVKMAGLAAMRGRPAIEVQMAVDAVLAFEGDSGLWPTDNTDGDLDNLVKALLDALNGAVYRDDRLVVQLNLVKVCLPRPAIAIRVKPADPTLGGLLDLLHRTT